MTFLAKFSYESWFATPLLPLDPPSKTVETVNTNPPDPLSAFPSSIRIDYTPTHPSSHQPCAYVNERVHWLIILKRIVSSSFISLWHPNQSDFPPNPRPLYRTWPSPKYEWSHGAFATDVACQQGTLSLQDTSVVRPAFWDLLMLQLLRQRESFTGSWWG